MAEEAGVTRWWAGNDGRGRRDETVGRNDGRGRGDGKERDDGGDGG